MCQCLQLSMSPDNRLVGHCPASPLAGLHGSIRGSKRVQKGLCAGKAVMGLCSCLFQPFLLNEEHGHHFLPCWTFQDLAGRWKEGFAGGCLRIPEILLWQSLGVLE